MIQNNYRQDSSVNFMSSESQIQGDQEFEKWHCLQEDGGDISSQEQENNISLIQDSISLQKILEDPDSEVVERKFVQRSSMRHLQKMPIEFDKFVTMFQIQGPLLVQSKKGQFKVPYEIIIFKPWNATLRNHQLALTNQTKSKYFNFNQINAKTEIYQDQIILSFNAYEKKEIVIHLKPGGQININDWFKVLNYQIKSSDESSPKNIITKIPKFWKECYISLYEFEKMANTLDLMLFKSNSFPAQIQRVVTNSDYDHVAMILRSSNDQLYLFDSNSEEGVGLSLWSLFKEDYQHINDFKVTYRRIEIERTEERMIKLQNFIRKTRGKKFSIGLIKLLKKRSLIDSHDQQDRTYFCSELVAAALKSVDLLPAEIACSQYWPSNTIINQQYQENFAQKNNLQLQHNAIINHEMILNFEL